MINLGREVVKQLKHRVHYWLLTRSKRKAITEAHAGMLRKKHVESCLPAPLRR